MSDIGEARLEIERRRLVAIVRRASAESALADAQAIINNPAGFYFNVHTQAFQAGVMRGQLVLQ